MRLVHVSMLQRVAGRRARRLTLLHILHNSARSLRLVILNAIYTRLHIRSGGDGARGEKRSKYQGCAAGVTVASDDARRRRTVRTVTAAAAPAPTQTATATATTTATSALERLLLVWPASTVLAGAPQVMSEL